jgi:hypothetical protein
VLLQRGGLGAPNDPTTARHHGDVTDASALERERHDASMRRWRNPGEYGNEDFPPVFPEKQAFFGQGYSRNAIDDMSPQSE